MIKTLFHVKTTNNFNEFNFKKLLIFTIQGRSAFKSKVIKGLTKTFQLPKWHNYLSILYKESILIRRNIGYYF